LDDWQASCTTARKATPGFKAATSAAKVSMGTVARAGLQPSPHCRGRGQPPAPQGWQHPSREPGVPNRRYLETESSSGALSDQVLRTFACC